MGLHQLALEASSIGLSDSALLKAGLDTNATGRVSLQELVAVR